ncbi:MAG: indole-3-glycerol-phosphate synthase [bacterium]
MVGVHRGINNDCRFSSAILKAKEKGTIPLVSDIKPISPRDGDLLGKRNPGELAGELAKAGACALSVVTEKKHFGGSITMLREVIRAVPLPVLRKDFFSSPDQIVESHKAGAAAVLLTLCTISDSLAPVLYQCTRDLGMEALVEVHTEHEIERALALCPTMIGINNRNLLELEKDSGDVSVTEKLAPLIPDTIVTISESSLLTSRDIYRAIQAGADAVLVGTAILQSMDSAARLGELIFKGGN